MPRGEHLSEREVGQIEAYKTAGFSERQIARRIGRSKTAVHQCLARNGESRIEKRSGRPGKLSPKDKRRILRAASNSTISTRQIQENLHLQVHRETVRRVLVESSNLIHCRMQSAPALKPVHKEKRLEFARQNMRTEWNRVSF